MIEEIHEWCAIVVKTYRRGVWSTKQPPAADKQD